MKFYIKGDMVGVVMTKKQLAALYCGHIETPAPLVRKSLNLHKEQIGSFSELTDDEDFAVHIQIEEFLEAHKDG